MSHNGQELNDLSLLSQFIIPSFEYHPEAYNLFLTSAERKVHLKRDVIISWVDFLLHRRHRSQLLVVNLQEVDANAIII